MATAQEMWSACEAAKAFGFTGIALVYRPEEGERHELGELVRIVKDRGPFGEVVDACHNGDRSEYLVIYEVSELRAWLFHFINGELFHQ